MKRYRLTARAQMHGEVREPGYVFTLADGEKGPHRTVSARPGVNIADHLGSESLVVDEPLFEKLSEEQDQAITEAEAKALDEADAHAAACAARDAEQADGAETISADAPAGDDAAHRDGQDADGAEGAAANG